MQLTLGNLKLKNLRPDNDIPILSQSKHFNMSPEGERAFLSEVSPGLYCGDFASACNLELLESHRIDLVVNLVKGLQNKFLSQFAYENFEIDDNPMHGFDENLTAVIRLIRGHIQNGRRVLVHCRKGISRAPSVAIGYLIINQNLSFDAAFEKLRMANPKVDPNLGFIVQLQQLASQTNL